MKTMIIDGKEITTNWIDKTQNAFDEDGNRIFDYEEYPYLPNRNYKNSKVLMAQWNETENQMFERLVASGYTKITFYRLSTRVRGITQLCAVCR